MGEQTLVGIIEKGRTVDVRVRLTTFRDQGYVDIRVFIVEDASGERTPTRKGVAIPVQKIPELRRLIERAEAEAREAGLLDENREQPPTEIDA